MGHFSMKIMPLPGSDLGANQQVAVALVFLAGLEVSQVGADDLGLGIADQHVAAMKREIGRAHIGAPLRFVDHGQARINRLEQLLQRRPIGMLGRRTRGIGRIQLLEIG